MKNSMSENTVSKEDLNVVENFSYLDKHNQQLDKKIRKIKTQVDIARNLKGYVSSKGYFLNRFSDFLFDIIKGKFDIEKKDIDITLLDRKNFGADICIKIQNLINSFGVKYYASTIVPAIKEMIINCDIYKDGLVESIDTKGIYLNLKLNDLYLLRLLESVIQMKDRYGENMDHKDESIVIDYSSPNTAKHLHAGHIRSTILGHVLGNIYEANGYTIHRTNHVNDRGGFGVLIQGYNKRSKKLENYENKNDMLFFIYTLFRQAEKYANSQEEFLLLKQDEIKRLKEFFGDFDDYQSFKNNFNIFMYDANISFKKLEKGEKQEVEIWEKIVDRSMQDFQKFYDTLDIHQDYVIGESFYSNQGKAIILKNENDGKVKLFTQELANQQIDLLKKDFENGKIKEKEFENYKREILNDVDSYVVMLNNFERFVVLKGNKSSIYATRDIGAIDYRINTFNPSKIIYVVGQEQQDHFNKLFEFSKNIKNIEKLEFKHLYFGFYLDEDSKKKLSSREGASNVNKILSESIKFFKDKYNNDQSFSEEEKENIAKNLGVGSIVYNDIKKDKKGPVLISKDISKTIQKFEESGGAYIIYTSCRAKSILNKYGKEMPSLNQILVNDLEAIEISLINKINQFPIIIRYACQNHDPALLAEFLYNIARDYNTFYNSCNVLKSNNKHRLILSKAVSQVIDNGLKICHIKPLDRI